jgi:hypothetical protein
VTGNLDQVPADAAIGDFTDADALVEVLRERIAALHVSYGVLDDLTELGEGGVAKYLAPLRVKQLTMVSLLKLTTALGLRGVLVIDPELARKMSRHWKTRDETKAHAQRCASTLSTKTVRRVMPQVAAEMGRRGGCKTRDRKTPDERQVHARMAANARWRRGEVWGRWPQRRSRRQ